MAKATPTKTVELYNGEISVDFFGPTEDKPNRHYYKKDDERLISVTSALGIIDKPGLIYWAVNQACEHIADLVQKGIPITAEHIEAARVAHKERAQEAADIGSLVHNWAEDYINGKNPDMPTDEKVLNGVTAFLQWVDKHNVQFLSSERLIYSRKHGYVGHMDAEAVIDGKKCVVDFKTSKRAKNKTGIYENYLYQTAAYQKAAQEEGSEYDGPRHIVRFDKETGNFEVVKVRGIQKDYKAFISALTLKKRAKELS